MPRHFFGTRNGSGPVVTNRTSPPSMTGADSRVARDPEALNFLARVAAEKRHGSRPWPGFDLQQLESFLSRAGVDLETARKDHAEATEHMPEIVREPERCIPFLKGASFLADGVENVCSGLRRLYQTAPRTFRAGEEGGA